MTPDINYKSKGYPDILVGGPGLEYPVIKDTEYEKLKKSNADKLSNQYQETIK